jgi:hypothetical protein
MKPGQVHARNWEQGISRRLSAFHGAAINRSSPCHEALLRSFFI